MKFEELPGGFGHLDAKNDARLIRLVRETIGEDRDLMIDVQNAWNDVGQAIATCKAIAPYNVYFLEAPLPADNLEAYRRLAEAVDIRIAAGDWGFTTRFEFMDLMEGQDRGQMESCGHSHHGVPTVGTAEQAFAVGHLGNFHDFGNAPGAHGAGLHHIDASTPSRVQTVRSKCPNGPGWVSG
jgi:hypothetical protein